jgi:kynurenine formamidase
MAIEPVRTEQFTGNVDEGGAVNFRNVYLNPHGHGTHTESAAHILPGAQPPISEVLKQYWFTAQLVTVTPEVYSGKDLAHMKPGDAYIGAATLAPLLCHPAPTALVVRTLPNPPEKLHRDYSHSNPPYFEPQALHLLAKAGVDHLLTDLPSVDRESDEGLLLAHRAWWGNTPPYDRTITEMVYVPNEVEDGQYLLNLMLAPFQNDAAPSYPVLYRIH